MVLEDDDRCDGDLRDLLFLFFRLSCRIFDNDDFLLDGSFVWEDGDCYREVWFVYCCIIFIVLMLFFNVLKFYVWVGFL